ncbi:CRISPR-associated endoribonuclease Cas6 [Romboutsia lituseburensis]|uniref:CRISPR-associated endoribonuclease Cas6 n=1 Tax=Romboutsia lituseburensis TaxID=1537 RepID=UPI00215A4476|nr:CRISPR-associated endoribonuclease Cas6 [Romboutsia lituseburensis]MCR8744479.1 CRISPR-associated endoribonuclease Cas6 [Romboutsia lituseburensis]
MKIQVYQISCKVFTLKNILTQDAQCEICKIIDSSLSKNKDWLEFHKTNEYKNYCFDSLYPIPKDKIYKSNQIYTFTIRTINEELARYLQKILANEFNDTIKCLTTKIKIIPKKFIEKIYSISPMIMKSDNGYWKNNLSLRDFEKRLIENLIKKYNRINNTKIDEDFEFYTTLEFKNRKPCTMNIKNVKLLGDKISLNISDNEIAQELAYMSLGVGLLECNSRGAGFMNYRWL